jgi:BTG family protein
MSDTAIKPEIKCAAAWWANKLREEPRQDNGDPLQSAFATAAALTRRRPNEEQIQRFEAKLAELIALQPGFQPDMWDPNNPTRAGAYRGLHVDYHPPEEMVEAAEAAGIRDIDLLLPIKTNMFIDPGSVRVGCGYKAPLVEVYATGGGPVRFRDLVFREHEHVSPPFVKCNYCGASGCILSVEIPLPGREETALVTLCSRGCESAFKREPKADEWLADFLAKAEAYQAGGADVEWPEEIDA